MNEKHGETPEQIANKIIDICFQYGGMPDFENIKKQVAAEIREAVETEREACANLAETLSNDRLYPYSDACGKRIFNAIRSRL